MNGARALRARLSCSFRSFSSPPNAVAAARVVRRDATMLLMTNHVTGLMSTHGARQFTVPSVLSSDTAFVL